MERRQDRRVAGQRLNDPVRLRDFELRSQQRLRGGCSQAHDQSGAKGFKFRIQPRPAGKNLARQRLLVNAEFSSWLPLEVLHRVRHVDDFAVNSGLLQAYIEQFSGGPDKWMAFYIFAVAWLFADHHHAGLRRLAIWYVGFHLAEYGLRCIAIEIASLSPVYRLA